MEQGGWVYILTNKTHSVLYTGVTSDIENRTWQHKTGEGAKFTKRYNVTKLVFAERFPTIMQAIDAEKNIKAGSRQDKVDLIDARNPEWRDLTR